MAVAKRYGIGFDNSGNFTAFPIVRTRINADNLDLRAQVPTGIVAILGAGAGFFPPKVATPLPLDIGSPQRFLTAGSDLLLAAQYAAKPFAQLDRGAGQVYLVPVTPATPAVFTLTNSGSTALALLTTEGYGLAMNGVLVKSQAGKLFLTLPTATGSRIETYTYTSIADLVAQINEKSGICAATFQAEGTPITFTNTAMTGGTEPSPSNTDWSDSLNALNGIRVNCIHVATGSSTIWAMLAAYCTLKRCRGFIGSATTRNWNGVTNRQTALAALIAEAALLNTPRVMHVGLGADGLPGYITAARRAALSGALDPSTPTTFKHTDFQSLEATLDIDTEVGNESGLLFNGVSPEVPDPQSPNTFLVSRGLSTWTGDDNLYRREHSVLAGVDAITDQCEAALGVLRGSEGTPAVGTRAANIVESVLKAALDPNARVRINGYRASSINVTFAGTILTVSAAITPIPPINFIDIGLTLEATTFTITPNVNLAA